MSNKASWADEESSDDEKPVAKAPPPVKAAKNIDWAADSDR
jgi:hypothetical protein